MTGTEELRRGGRRRPRGETPGRALCPGAGPRRAAAGIASSGLRRPSPRASAKRGSAPRDSRGPAPAPLDPRCGRVPLLGGLGVLLPGTFGEAGVPLPGDRRVPVLPPRGCSGHRPPPLPAAVPGAEARGRSGPEGPAAAARSAPGAGTPRAAPGGQSGGLCVSGEGSGRVSPRGLQCHRHSGGCQSNAGRYRLQPGNQPFKPAKVWSEMVRKNLFSQMATDFSCLLFVVPRPAGASHSRMTQSFAPLFQQGGWDAVACSMLHSTDSTAEW